MTAREIVNYIKTQMPLQKETKGEFKIAFINRMETVRGMICGSWGRVKDRLTYVPNGKAIHFDSVKGARQYATVMNAILHEEDLQDDSKIRYEYDAFVQLHRELWRVIISYHCSEFDEDRLLYIRLKEKFPHLQK